MFNPTRIHRHMHVVSSKRELLGMVDHLLGSHIQLARDVLGDRQAVPLVWVHHIDDKIHLTRSAEDLERFWAGERFE